MPKNGGELTNRITFDLMMKYQETLHPGWWFCCSYVPSLGVALGVMVANLCVSKAGFEEYGEELGKIAEEGQEIKEFLVNAIDEIQMHLTR